MIQAVIFDLDGVLVSTDELHFAAWKRIAKELAITNFTQTDNIRQRGVSRMQSLNILLEKTDVQYSEQEKEQLCEKKNDYYKQMLFSIDSTAVLSGAKETISYLKSRGILIGVGSVSKNAPEILLRTGLDEMIDKVSCGVDITHSKPHPEVFLLAASRLGIPPENCLVVEDSEAGLVAAKIGNMETLAVGTAQGSPNADYSALSLATDILWEKILGQ